MHFFEKLHFLDKMFLKVEKLFWYPSHFPKKKKKNMVSKCIKSPKYSFKSNLFFSYGGWGLTLRIFLRSKWLLDLPDLEIFLSIFDFFNGKK